MQRRKPPAGLEISANIGSARYQVSSLDTHHQLAEEIVRLSSRIGERFHDRMNQLLAYFRRHGSRIDFEGESSKLSLLRSHLIDVPIIPCASMRER